MKYILGLLLAVSFNANACSPQDYWNCPPPPVQAPIIIPAPIVPGTPPVTIDFGQATVIKK